MASLPTAYARRPAMGTFFEVFLAGDDDEHLLAVAAAVLDEVSRLERLLSRFDPAAEIVRINREAGRRPVRVDTELWDILCLCEHWRRATDGHFDATGGGLVLDEARRTIRLDRPGAFLDLGGFAKGYALDQAAAILRRFGVASGLVNGGTSSVLAVGRHPDGWAWPVAIRDPFGDEGAAPVARLSLADQGFSCSATLAPGQTASDLIAPHDGRPLTAQAACIVIAPTALEAEVLSTALLVMGNERAAEYLGRNARPGLSVGWIDAAGGEVRWEWLREAP